MQADLEQASFSIMESKRQRVLMLAAKIGRKWLTKARSRLTNRRPTAYSSDRPTHSVTVNSSPQANEDRQEKQLCEYIASFKQKSRTLPVNNLQSTPACTHEQLESMLLEYRHVRLLLESTRIDDSSRNGHSRLADDLRQRIKLAYSRLRQP